MKFVFCEGGSAILCALGITSIVQENETTSQSFSSRSMEELTEFFEEYENCNISYSQSGFYEESSMV
jgi:predicted nucleotidyltransferase